MAAHCGGSRAGTPEWWFSGMNWHRTRQPANHAHSVARNRSKNDDPAHRAAAGAGGGIGPGVDAVEVAVGVVVIVGVDGAGDGGDRVRPDRWAARGRIGIAPDVGLGRDVAQRVIGDGLGPRAAQRARGGGRELVARQPVQPVIAEPLRVRRVVVGAADEIADAVEGIVERSDRARRAGAQAGGQAGIGIEGPCRGDAVDLIAELGS